MSPIDRAAEVNSRMIRLDSERRLDESGRVSIIAAAIRAAERYVRVSAGLAPPEPAQNDEPVVLIDDADSNQAWAEAIEAAAKTAETYKANRVAREIRKLATRG